MLMTMELKLFKSIMTVLNERQVNYLLVGGMAVVAHGYGRMTFDIDLVIQLKPANILHAFDALSSLGYQPRIPITGATFSVRENREKWICEKGMTVLNFYSDKYPTMTVDIFVSEPFNFDETYKKSIAADLEGIIFHYVDLATLIKMKEEAGRPVDLEDIRNLRILADDQ